MYFRLSLAALLLAFSASAQLNRFQKVEWIVRPSAGLNTTFLVDFKLTSTKGKTVLIEHNTDVFKWDAFTFKSDRPIGFNYGVGFYYNMNDFEGVDSIRVEATCENEALNSVFYIPVRYCIALDLAEKKMVFNEYFSLDWIMIMNTGERFGYDKNWVNLTGLINESDPRFTLANNNLKTNTAEPFRSGLIRFRHPNLKRPVFEWKMPLVVSNQLNLDFSGEPGRAGRNGQNGTQPSQSGGYGEPGENGLPAEKSVTVFVRSYSSDSIPLVEVIAISDNRRKHTFISAANPKINIDASGGPGGSGGNGGNGANAQQTEKAYDRLSGGSGGVGGYGGNGGNAGTVLILIDSNLRLTESNFFVNTNGGDGGSAGNAGTGGTNDRGNDGLLVRALVRNERVSGTTGLPGRTGNSGVSTFRFVNSESLENKLKETGFK
ncbi:MAG: hypothetical protein A3D31_16240 [Candidatus Fluviicola riflensis]|nr:MAG: hypothetical protein CHH17_01180 [Candidatus Fluviicola riflensis]OGS78503.1 MAG: hypothetical protein A3D31_16240 [Candidatus Fluviicola riflensis]OGS85569.1 MAG: hypothetical protein A2724_13175 [Fluviicola sp. RIFCSPHIGHO2_01_FULL_43_53]OGS87610.1 MAG: hypothetical protein A3E30_09595 [Fluviicola sp. RIFCSPHIGHO2_12_FULL_43_24]